MGAVTIQELSGVDGVSDEDLFLVEHTDDGQAFRTGSVTYGQLRSGMAASQLGYWTGDRPKFGPTYTVTISAGQAFRLNSAAMVVPWPASNAARLTLDGVQLDSYNYYDAYGYAYGTTSDSSVTRVLRYTADSGAELAHSTASTAVATCQILPIVNSLEDCYCSDSAGYSEKVNLLDFYQSWTAGTLSSDFDPVVGGLGLVSASNSVKVVTYDGELYSSYFALNAKGSLQNVAYSLTPAAPTKVSSYRYASGVMTPYGTYNNRCVASGVRFTFVNSSSYYQKMSDIWFNLRVFQVMTDVSTEG